MLALMGFGGLLTYICGMDTDPHVVITLLRPPLLPR